MIDERSEVQWGRTNIPYAVKRSARRGTVSISIDPQDGVLLTAPGATSIERLDRVVRSKGLWIVQRLRRASELPAPLPAREFVSGETFFYLGRQYRLLLRSGAPSPIVARGSRIELAIPRKFPADRAIYVRAALVDWYRRRASEKLTKLADEWAHRLGVQFTDLVIREQEKRWASCDAKGVVRLNWRIVQAPRRCVEYVVAHELVHLRHANHAPSFWATLGRAMPDYEQRRNQLRTFGPQAIW